jgi:replication initiation protein RepC
MGRYMAATAVAVIAAKSEQIHSVGGYLRAMTEHARQGELHLARSVYGLAEKQGMVRT